MSTFIHELQAVRRVWASALQEHVAILPKTALPERSCGLPSISGVHVYLLVGSVMQKASEAATEGKYI